MESLRKIAPIINLDSLPRPMLLPVLIVALVGYVFYAGSEILGQTRLAEADRPAGFTAKLILAGAIPLAVTLVMVKLFLI